MTEQAIMAVQYVKSIRSSYAEQLRHPNWQRRRLERLSAAGWRCESCHDKEATLNVHHRRYLKGHAAWEYDDHDLAVLCETCHQREHQAADLLRRVLAGILWYPDSPIAASTAAFLAGYARASFGGIDGTLADEAERADPSWYDAGVMVAGLDMVGWSDVAALIQRAHDEDRLPMQDAVRAFINYRLNPEGKG